MNLNPLPPERDNFSDDIVDAALARLLPVRAPHRTERAMLRATANGLHRTPHVFVGRQQIPSRGDERARLRHVRRCRAAAAFPRRDRRARVDQTMSPSPLTTVARRHARGPRLDRGSSGYRRRPPSRDAPVRAGRADTPAGRSRCGCQSPRRHRARRCSGSNGSSVSSTITGVP